MYYFKTAVLKSQILVMIFDLGVRNYQMVEMFKTILSFFRPNLFQKLSVFRRLKKLKFYNIAGSIYLTDFTQN
jgi:hypothetical protein